MRAVLVAVSVLLVAGCAAPAADTRPDGSAVAPVVLADLTSAGCAYNDLIFLAPLDTIQAQLPPGFTARAFMGPTGGFVINLFACTDGFAWAGADMFALVEPPQMPEVVETFDASNRTPRGAEHYPLDLYMLAAHTDHEGLREVFERAGMPLGGGAPPTRTLVPAQTGSMAVGSFSDANGTLLTYTVAAAETAALAAHHRQWRVTDEGTVLVERLFTAAGDPVRVAQGSARCVVEERSEFARILGELPCSMGQDILGPFGWTGRAYAFPGVAPSE